MDFSNRNVQSQPASAGAPAAASAAGGGKKKKSDSGKLGRIVTVVLVAAVVILLGAVIATAASSGGKSESKYVDSTKLQAVFLNTGQVYFGNIKTMNNKYFVLTNIYYLQTASTGTTGTTSAGSSVSLVKLGCELHEPYDQMVINRDQVTFWENLQSNGQVATAVSTFKKQNPNGQKCADQSSSSSTNSSNSVQKATTNNGGSSTTSGN
ncbi:MAG: hypothetical protein AAB436_01525 [Patescibacteria group bacterium]